MMRKLEKVQWKLLRYSMFMGVVGGVASFVGPLDSGMHNAVLGVIVGRILLGRRFENAVKELIKIIQESADETFDD